MSARWLGGIRDWLWYSSVKRRTAVLLLLLVLLVLGISLRKPLLANVHGWRAKNLIEQAKAFAEEEDWAEMQRTAAASLQISPSIEALRLYVQASRRTREPNRLHYAAFLFGHPEATALDRSAVLKAFVDANDLIAVAELVKGLREEDYDTEMRRQVVRFLVKAGQWKEAMVLADLEAAQGRFGCDLVVARGLVRARQAGTRREVNDRIRRALAGSNRESSLAALRLLASLPENWIDRGLASLVVEQFKDATLLAVGDRLAVDLFRVATNPSKRMKLIAANVGQLQEKHLEPLVGWLLRLGETEQVAALTKGRSDLTSTVFRQRATALNALGRHDELAEELTHPPNGIPEVVLLSVRASVASKRGEDSEAVDLWRRAFALAARTPDRNDYFTIAAIAERNGESEKQMEAMSLALERSLGVPSAMHEVKPLLEWLYRRGEADRLLRICYRLLEREPGNPILINMQHYLRLLLDDAATDVVPQLEQLVAAFPRELSFRSTLALAQVKAGLAQRALETFSAHPVEPSSYPVAEKAIYAAALLGAGRGQEAAKLLESPSWEELPRFEADSLRALTTPDSDPSSPRTSPNADR